jgi:hypothetical protein
MVEQVARDGRDFAARRRRAYTERIDWMFACDPVEEATVAQNMAVQTMLHEARPSVHAAACALLVALALSGGQSQAQSTSEASLVGRILLDGAPLDQKPPAVDAGPSESQPHIDQAKPRQDARAAKSEPKDESLIVSKDGGIANVLIWLRTYGASPVGPLKKLPAVRIVAASGRFEPHVRAFWIVRPLEWVNGLDDEVANFTWEPQRGMPWNVMLNPRQRQQIALREGETLPVKLTNQLHSSMSAYILPLEHPYFAVTEEDGRFEIPSSPVGNWDFAMWHERAGRLPSDRFPTGRFQLTIEPGRNDLGDMRIAPRTVAAQPDRMPPEQLAAAPRQPADDADREPAAQPMPLAAVAANPRAPDLSPLHYAAMAGNTARVRALLDEGADVNVQQRAFLGTPLQYAAQNGHGETVQALIERGATIDARDANNRTPLIWAAMGGHAEAIRRLLDAGADTSAANAGGWTPLHYAASRGHDVACRLLVERGADQEVRNAQGKTPAEVAPRRALANAAGK